MPTAKKSVIAALPSVLDIMGQERTKPKMMEIEARTPKLTAPRITMTVKKVVTTTLEKMEPTTGVLKKLIGISKPKLLERKLGKSKRLAGERK